MSELDRLAIVVTHDNKVWIFDQEVPNEDGKGTRIKRMLLLADNSVAIQVKPSADPKSVGVLFRLAPITISRTVSIFPSEKDLDEAMDKLEEDLEGEDEEEEEEEEPQQPAPVYAAPVYVPSPPPMSPMGAAPQAPPQYVPMMPPAPTAAVPPPPPPPVNGSGT